MPYIGKSPQFGVRNRFVYVVSANATSVSGADANGATLTFSDGAYVDVYLNGVLLKPTTDYNTNTTNTISGISSMSASDEVTVVVYDVFTVADTVSATSGGTFSGAVTHTGGITSTTGTFNGDLTIDTNVLKVDTSNNKVGVGTASPQDTLHTYLASGQRVARFEANSSISAHISFKANNTSLMPTVGVKDEDFYISTGDAVERMRIDGSNGHVGIGGTPDNSYQVCVKESGAGVGIKLEPSGSGCESYIQLKFQNSSNTTRTGMIKGDNGDSLRIASADAIGIGMETSDSQALGIGSDGSLRLQHVYDDTTSNSANMYIHSDGTHQVMRSTSSERYKKNIETLEDKYADAVLGLRPVWYKSKCEADNADYSHWGLIAEEVAKVDPRLVTFRNEYTEDTGDGKYKVIQLDAPQAESVQYDRFVPHLINICKRQEDKITALEARIKTLEDA